MEWPRRLLEEYEAFHNGQHNRFPASLIGLIFDTSMPPCFFAGNLKGAKYGLLGLNPGLTKHHKKELELYNKTRKANKSVLDDFYGKLFTIFKAYNIRSDYYYKFSVLLCGVLNIANIPKPLDRYDLLQENLVNFDLIPYHSTSYKIGEIQEKHLSILKPYIETTKELIQMSSTEYLFISGKPWKLLVEDEQNKQDDEDKMCFFKGDKLKSFSAQFGVWLGRKFVWFDKFVTSIRGITNKDLYYVGEQIADKWGIA